MDWLDLLVVQGTLKSLLQHHSSKALKILQARLQQYVNQELQMYKLDLENAEEPEIKLPTSYAS